MLVPTFFLFLCSKFLFIKSEDNGDINIEITSGENCTIDQNNSTFTEGQNVTLAVQHYRHSYIDYGWWRHISSSGSKDLYSDLRSNRQEQIPITYTALVDKSMEGTWEFQFLYYGNNENFNQNNKKIIFKGRNFTQSICRTNATIVPAIKKADHDQYQSNENVITYVIIVLGTVAVVIILAQTAYIIYLIRKVQKLKAHNHLSKKAEPPNDTARYCSNPRQKKLKVAASVDDNSRDSVIYEAPNIELSGNARLPAMLPPQPPAINTIPQREISVANRPPLPLPPQDHSRMFEVYEEMDTADTYEPPPIVTTMTPTLPMPPKKVRTANLLDVKEDTLKLRRGNKPSVTPKPQRPRPDHMTPANEFDQARRRRNNDSIPKANEVKPGLRRKNQGPTNELEEALRKRNNVMQVPVKSIPDPSSRGTSPKPRPLPAVNSKPRPPPVQNPAQEEIYYNEAQASSDEEWTYEPLKPFKSYDTNLYSL